MVICNFRYINLAIFMLTTIINFILPLVVEVFCHFVDIYMSHVVSYIFDKVCNNFFVLFGKETGPFSFQFAKRVMDLLTTGIKLV